jgi:hypothetical protein
MNAAVTKAWHWTTVWATFIHLLFLQCISLRSLLNFTFLICDDGFLICITSDHVCFLVFSCWGVKGGRLVRLTALLPSVSQLSRENMGASMSHSPMGLHSLLQGYLYFFFYLVVLYDTVRVTLLLSKGQFLFSPPSRGKFLIFLLCPFYWPGQGVLFRTSSISSEWPHFLIPRLCNILITLNLKMQAAW